MLQGRIKGFSSDPVNLLRLIVMENFWRPVKVHNLASHASPLSQDGIQCSLRTFSLASSFRHGLSRVV
jgi:hypothetical protein